MCGKSAPIMPSIELSETEQQLLVQTLEADLRELRDEIRHTDDHDFKDSLKAREKTLVGVLAKLRG